MLDLTAIPAIDQHAHNLLRPDALAQIDYLSAFTEALDPEQIERFASQTLFFRRSLHDLAELFNCAPDVPSVLMARQRLGFEEVARRSFAAANLGGVLLDDGLLADAILPVEWHQVYVPSSRLLRVEHVTEQLIAAAPSWSAFVAAFHAALEPPPSGVVGYKSIVAYRTGLAIEASDEGAAQAAFGELKRASGDSVGVRLARKPLNDWVVHETLEIASRRGMPVQFHTGFGDPDLDLRLADPLHLRPLLEDPRYRRVPFVLLHASHPFTRHAAYLAAVYPHVFVDFGLAVPTLSVAGMRAAVRQLLEQVPLTKILYSSDAHVIAELFYLGARWGRRALAAELERAVSDGDLDAGEVDRVAEQILAGNARRLYGLSS
jgi:uncharacterized protein